MPRRHYSSDSRARKHRRRDRSSSDGHRRNGHGGGHGRGGAFGHGAKGRDTSRDRHNNRHAPRRESDSYRRSRSVSSSRSSSSSGTPVDKKLRLYPELVENATFANAFVVERVVGEGTFARVARATSVRNSTSCALKVFRREPRYLDAAKDERDVLSALNRKDPAMDYPFLRHFDFLVHDGHATLVFPLCGPSLYDFINVDGDIKAKRFSLSVVRSIAYQLLRCIDFVHACGYVHTDLKPENILFRERTYHKVGGIPVPCTTEIKVIDFGNAELYSKRKASRVVGTRHYRAPEVLLGLGWGYPSDLWAVGCILAELYSGTCVFMTHDDTEHLALIMRCVGRIPSGFKTNPKHFDNEGNLRWPTSKTSREDEEFVNKSMTIREHCDEDYNPEFYELCAALLTIDPAKRVTASKALEMKFFTDCK